MSSKGVIHAPIDETESEPLLSRTDNTSSKLSSTPDHPPPSSTSTGIRPNVEYSYHPVYPRTGSSQYVIGRLARNKKEAIQTIQEGIPELAIYSSERLQFKIEIEAQPLNNWSVILDGAWEGVARNPPCEIAVVVTDLPGEAEMRKRRTTSRIIGILAACVLLLSLIITLGSRSSR